MLSYCNDGLRYLVQKQKKLFGDVSELDFQGKRAPVSCTGIEPYREKRYFSGVICSAHEQGDLAVYRVGQKNCAKFFLQ